jgi:hypothetical protein
MTVGDALDDEIAGRVVPVNHAPAAPRSTTPAAGRDRATQMAKFGRRVAALTPGRWEVILTVDEKGLVDWSFRPLGKVEQ